MASTSSPYGLKLNTQGGGVPRGVRKSWILTTNTATGFFEGDILNMASGVLIPSAATPTTTLNTASPWAIFDGCEYFTAQGKQFSNTFPAAGYTAYSSYGTIRLFGYDDPAIEFRVQADGVVTQAKLGLNAQLATFSSGNTTTGKSGITLIASSAATTNTFGVKIIDFISTTGTGSGASEAFTECVCVWNANVHQYRNILGA